MLKLNEANLKLPYRGTVISFSHFLPMTALPFDDRKIKAMGCSELEDQIWMAKSKAHVYGHSDKRVAVKSGDCTYINNFHGLHGPDGEGAKHMPLLIWDGATVCVKLTEKEDLV